MITEIGGITLLVHDQDEALKFYTETLRLEKRQDATFGEGQRWLSVGAPGKSLQITLVRADTDEKRARVGSQVADHVLFVLYTDDCRKDHERLKSKGVQFSSPPQEQAWGVEALFKDLYGNVIDLLEPRPM